MNTTISSATATTSVSQAAPVARCKARDLRPWEVQLIASKLADTSRAAARNAIRAIGVAASEGQIDTVLAARVTQRIAAWKRSTLKASKRLGRTIDSLPWHPGRASMRLPSGSPQERLHAIRISAVTRTAKELFRYGGAGGCSFSVRFATSSADVAYAVNVGQSRNVYRGRFKGWAARVDNHVICVPADWRVRVQARGLATAGGMMTLDAHVLEAPQGLELFAAVWAAQGRGFSVTVSRGFIARSGDEIFHAATPEAALAGVRRRALHARRADPSAAAEYQVSVEAFIEKWQSHDCHVRLDDARATGSCEFGIRSWCHAVGLDYAAGSAPLRDVLKAFRIRPQVEVRRAVLHAIRMNRQVLNT